MGTEWTGTLICPRPSSWRSSTEVHLATHSHQGVRSGCDRLGDHANEPAASCRTLLDVPGRSDGLRGRVRGGLLAKTVLPGMGYARRCLRCRFVPVCFNFLDRPRATPDTRVRGCGRHPGSPGPAHWLTIKLHRRGDGEVLRIRSRRLRNSASTGCIDTNRLRSSIS